MPSSRATVYPVVLLHADAPPKPAPGAPCNGCGLCCMAEPCPLGVLRSRRRRGACVALRWLDGERRHVCGVLADALQAQEQAGRGPGRLLAALRVRLLRRWIAAGAGCDCTLEAAPSRTISHSTDVS